MPLRLTQDIMTYLIMAGKIRRLKGATVAAAEHDLGASSAPGALSLLGPLRLHRSRYVPWCCLGSLLTCEIMEVVHKLSGFDRMEILDQAGMLWCIEAPSIGYMSGRNHNAASCRCASATGNATQYCGHM